MFATARTETASQRVHPAIVGASSANWRTPTVTSESVPQTVWHWLAAALDELDYGIVLLFDGTHVVHINDAARVELDDRHPLDVAPLHEAVSDASLRGMRRLLTLGKDAERASVSVIPLEAADAGPRAVLVVLGKRSVCETLSVQGFARSYGLTSAETRVSATASRRRALPRSSASRSRRSAARSAACARRPARRASARSSAKWPSCRR